MDTFHYRATIRTAISQGLRVRLVYKDGRGHEAVTPARLTDFYVVIEGPRGYETRTLDNLADAELLWIHAMREGQ